MQNSAWQGRTVGRDPGIQCICPPPKNVPGCHRKECPPDTVGTVDSSWSDCVSSAWQVVLQKWMFCLRSSGPCRCQQCHCSGQAGTEGRQELLLCRHTYCSLESPMPWDGWGWDHMIKSSLMQCFPAAGGLCAACLKQLIALPEMRRVLWLCNLK